MMKDYFLQSKIVSAVLNTSFIGGAIINVGGHITRVATHHQHGKTFIAAGYAFFAISLLLICFRAYLTHGSLSRRYIPWLIITFAGPILFGLSQNTHVVIKGALFFVFAILMLWGTYAEYRHHHSNQ